MHVLKPSVNNLTARIFVRAAGLDCEEIDAWGKTGDARVPGHEPRAPDADDRGGRPAARRALGELRDHAVPLQQARAGPVLSHRPGRARDGRQRDVLPRSARSIRCSTRATYPALGFPQYPGRGRRPRTPTTRRRRPRSRRRSTRSPSRSTCTARSSSTAGVHRRRPPVDRRHPPGGVARVPARRSTTSFPAWATEYMARDGVGARRRLLASRPRTCAATSPT